MYQSFSLRNDKKQILQQSFNKEELIKSFKITIQRASYNVFLLKS